MKLSRVFISYLVITFLLITNITSIVLFNNHLRSEKADKKEKIEYPNTRLGRFFRNELNLDNKQHNNFRIHRQQYHRSTNQLLSEMTLVRESMLNELQKISPDRKHLDTLAKKIGDQHVLLKQYTFDYYTNMQSELNPEQQKKLVLIFQSMLTEEGYAKTPRHNERHNDKHHSPNEKQYDHKHSEDSCSAEHLDLEIIHE